MADARWNHNTHYHRLVLRALPAGARDALDVGCGEGLLTTELARAGVPHVVGVDRDAEQIARAHKSGGAAEYVHADFLTHDFGEQFDFVVSIAALHHVDLGDGLRRLKQLVRRGGRLVVVGLGRRPLPADLPWDAVGFFVRRLALFRHLLVWDAP